MDFRQLRYFTAVGQLKNFSQAAERCFISQSAISHQIAKLELRRHQATDPARTGGSGHVLSREESQELVDMSLWPAPK